MTTDKKNVTSMSPLRQATDLAVLMQEFWTVQRQFAELREEVETLRVEVKMLRGVVAGIYDKPEQKVRIKPKFAPRMSAETLDLVAEIADKHGVELADMLSPSRKRPLSYARFECFHALRERGKSLPQIGRMFAIDHTAVLYGIRRHEASIAAGDAL